MRQFRPFSDLDSLYVIFPCEQRFLSCMAFSVYESHSRGLSVA